MADLLCWKYFVQLSFRKPGSSAYLSMIKLNVISSLNRSYMINFVNNNYVVFLKIRALHIFSFVASFINESLSPKSATTNVSVMFVQVLLHPNKRRKIK
jgi:hypothetical protein